MALGDWFLLFVRWLHLLGAVAWVGGSIFFFAILRPTPQSTAQDLALSRIAGQEFRNLVDVAITVLLVTGAILSISRLTSGHATVAYGVVLGLKIALAVWMFYLVWFRERRRPAPANQATPQIDGPVGAWMRTLTANNVILALGITVLLLADVLHAIFENALMGA